MSQKEYANPEMPGCLPMLLWMAGFGLLVWLILLIAKGLLAIVKAIFGIDDRR
jgi:hypothetical protein